MNDLLQRLGLNDENQRIEVSKALDLSKLALTPEEGFLLSRIDACGSIREILQVSTFPRDRTVDMLRRFADGNIVVAVGAKPAPGRAVSSPAKVREPKEAVDLPAELCFAIEDEFERLKDASLTPRQVLGLSEKAGVKDAKKVFLAATKKFHPDRFFRKKAGIYLEYCETIFSRLSQAMELLENTQAAKPAVPAKKSGFPKILSPIMDRVVRAREMYREAKTQAASDPLAAANTLRLAHSFDPMNAEIKKLLEEVEGRANLRRAIKHYEDGQKLEDMLALEQAVEAFQKAATCDPKNPEYQRALGQILLYKLKDPARALPFARRACELEPRLAENYSLCGYVFKAMQRGPEAILAFERVLQLDKSNLFAKNEIAHLRKIK